MFENTFENVKLEKGMYNLSGKSFSQYLGEIDPDENYENTAYANLDAFERQLKRFDIKIGGCCCDRVEKFFTTTESAVLFPEFIRRAIKKGFEDCCLEDIITAKEFCEGNYYSGCMLSEESYDTKAKEGETMPVSSIRESTTLTTLKKYGRVINASYEAVRQQRLDTFAVFLRSIGRKLANSLLTDAIQVLYSGSKSIETATSTLEYSDITALYGSFTDYDLNTLIVSPANSAKILSMQQLMETTANRDGQIYLPFGARMISTNKISDNYIMGLDKNFALEIITSSDIILETDKIIDRQLDETAVSISAGFKKIFKDSAFILNIKSE